MNIFLILENDTFYGIFTHFLKEWNAGLLMLVDHPLYYLYYCFFGCFRPPRPHKWPQRNCLYHRPVMRNHCSCWHSFFCKKNKWIYLVNRMRYKRGRVISQLVISESYVIKYGTYTYICNIGLVSEKLRDWIFWRKKCGKLSMY